ncbi:MAG: hypothetical protein PF445_12830, partial [Melioribacteraceae bacterium]|nr:hypothetical protein [Melioribacteraceae bacterium]
MNKLIITLLTLAIFLGGCQKIDYDGTFSFEPNKPQITEPILVKFLADSTKLSESNSVEMLVYQYDIDLLSTTEIEMKKEGIGWTAQFIPEVETKGIVIAFKDDEVIENNNS